MTSPVDGRWTCTVATPMGDQSFVLTVASAGDRFAGTTEGAMGAVEIEDGEVDGRDLSWTMRVTRPMPLTLDCRASVDGDAIAGTVKAGLFGSYKVAGVREG